MIPLSIPGPGRLWTTFTYGLQRGDPLTYLGLGLMVAVLALLAARRPRG